MEEGLLATKPSEWQQRKSMTFKRIPRPLREYALLGRFMGVVFCRLGSVLLCGKIPHTPANVVGLLARAHLFKERIQNGDGRLAGLRMTDQQTRMRFELDLRSVSVTEHGVGDVRCFALTGFDISLVWHNKYSGGHPSSARSFVTRRLRTSLCPLPTAATVSSGALVAGK
jgi:hypothetical protein